MDKHERILKFNDNFENWYKFRCLTVLEERYKIIEENLQLFENNYQLGFMVLANNETRLKSYFLESETDLKVEFKLSKMLEYYDKYYYDDDDVTVGQMLENLLNSSYYTCSSKAIDLDFYFYKSINGLNQVYGYKVDNMRVTFRESEKNQYMIIEFGFIEDKEKFMHYLIDLI